VGQSAQGDVVKQHASPFGLPFVAEHNRQAASERCASCGSLLVVGNAVGGMCDDACRLSRL